MSLREWTVGRLVAAWAVWLILAFGGAIAVAVVYAHGEASTVSGAPGQAGGSAVPRISGGGGVEFGTGGALVLLLTLVGPPAIVTATWMWQRGGGDRPPNDR